MAALQRERPVSAQKVLSDRKAKKGKKAPKKPLLEVLIGEEKQLNALVTSRAHTMKPATPKDLQRRRVIGRECDKENVRLWYAKKDQIERRGLGGRDATGAGAPRNREARFSTPLKRQDAARTSLLLQVPIGVSRQPPPAPGTCSPLTCAPGQQKGANVSTLKALRISRVSVAHTQFQKLIVWIPSVIISPQGLSKGECVVLDASVIAKNTS